MRRLDIILRTCLKSSLEENLKKQNYERICGSNREEMILKCLMSIIRSINNSNFNIHFTILDDNSSHDFLTKVKILLEKCNKSFYIKKVKNSGFNNSAYEQFLLASKCKDLVYTVEDDYLHESNAINNLLNAYFHLENRFKDKIALFPFDCPFRYEGGREESTTLLYDGSRYWRNTSHTTNTIFSNSSFFKKDFEVFKNLALNYPNVNESDTINTLYKKDLSEKSEKYNLFSPIPSISYHLSYMEPAEIKTEHLSWRYLWDNSRNIDLIDGWYNYEDFYQQVVNGLKDDSIICEIGSWLGKSTIGMALTNKKLNKNCKIYAIDTWKGSNEEFHKKYLKELKNISLYEKFLNNIEIYGVKDKITPIKKKSVEASIQFQDNSVDLVIIDGSHEYKDVLDDIKAWIPKVKKGGIISGDDYGNATYAGWDGVIKAVNDFFGKDNFQVYGTTWYKIL